MISDLAYTSVCTPPCNVLSLIDYLFSNVEVSVENKRVCPLISKPWIYSFVTCDITLYYIMTFFAVSSLLQWHELYLIHFLQPLSSSIEPNMIFVFYMIQALYHHFYVLMISMLNLICSTSVRRLDWWSCCILVYWTSLEV